MTNDEQRPSGMTGAVLVSQVATDSTVAITPPDRPYSHAVEWAQAGWSPIPVTRAKMPVLRGVTGWSGHDIDVERAAELLARVPQIGRHNLALRMKPGQLAIDVDAYHGGLETLAIVLERWGELPPTISSTNRDDGSDIRYFVCPVELRTVGNLGRIGPGVDLIQRHHRFAVVSGTHQSGRRYRTSTGGVLQAADAAELPDGWVQGLRIEKRAEIASDGSRGESPAPGHPDRSTAAPAGGDRAFRGSTIPSTGRLAYLLAYVGRAKEGERNSQLYWAACRAFDLPPAVGLPSVDAIARLLGRAADRVGLEQREADATIASARWMVGR